MKYYLGYQNNREYIPIKDSEIGSSIKEVVAYTLNFPSIVALKQTLFTKNLIPSTNVFLEYVIEKGPKEQKYYQPLQNTQKIYVAPAKMFFSLADLQYQLQEDANDLELVIFIYANYLKKYGLLNKTFNYVLNLDNNIAKLKTILEELQLIEFSEKTKQVLNVIDEYITFSGRKVSKERIAGYLEDLIASIKKDNHDIVNIFIYFKKYVIFNNIPCITNLNEWFRLIINNSKGVEKDGIDYDDYSLPVHKAEIFFNSLIYDYDFTKNEYKMVAGKRKIKERELFDLAVLIEEYYSALYQSYVEDVVVEYEDYSDEDEEEFLEEEDFVRLGTTSEEEGFKLRRRN